MTEWRNLTLDQLGRIVTGKTPPTADSENYGGAVPFVTPSDMDGRRLISETARCLTEKGLRTVANAKVPSNSVMVSCIGSDMGKSAISGSDCVTNQQINTIIVGPDFDPLFIYYNLSVRKDEIRSAASGSAQPIMNKSTFGRLRIRVPEKTIQTAIASVLGALDDKIELNRRMNETLEAMARAIFKDWFVEFGPTRAKMEGRAPYLAPDIWSLFPNRLDNDGKPEGWRIDRLGSFTELQNGYAFRSSDWQDDGVPVVKIGSVKPSVVDLTEFSFISQELAESRSVFKLKVGDVLVGLTGYVGETGRVPPTARLPMLNQRVGRFSSSGSFSPFVYACVRDPVFKAYAEGKAHGSAQPNVSSKDLLDYPVINAKRELFQVFENLISPLCDKSLANLGEIGVLATTRDLLLPKLMSGEIRVRDAEKAIEVAQ
jgi:type I restriction enzyme S subunit